MTKSIAIVGGGIAGLTAGIYGRLAGYRTDIFEKNSHPGGQCTGWDRQGYHIDNCIHWLTGTRPGSDLNDIWRTTHALTDDQEFIPCDQFFASEQRGVRAVLWKDLDRTRHELIELSPEDREEIERLIEHIRYAAECEVPAKKPMDAWSPLDYIRMGQSMPHMPRVMKEYGSIDLDDLAERFHHPAIKALITGYMPAEYQASSFLVSYATVASGNGEIPAGGSRAMAERMAKRFTDLGGTIHCSHPVKKVVIKNGRAIGIETAAEDFVAADYVICAVDTMEMFDKLIGREYMDKKWKNAYSDSNAYPLSSGLQAAFGVDRDAYPETGSLIFDCEPFLAGGTMTNRMAVGASHEPGFAPEGKIVLQVNILQRDPEYLYWKSLSPDAYTEEKRIVVGKLQERIETRFPGLRGHMTFLDCWTPVTYEKWCNAYHGAYMSFITKKDVKSFSVKGTLKGIKDLYIASQWIMAPGGLPVAAASGRFAIWRLAHKDRINHPLLNA